MSFRRMRLRETLPDDERHSRRERKFFQRMTKGHMEADRHDRTITNNLIHRYFRTDEKDAQERLAEWGDKAIPKIYIHSRKWEDPDFTIRAIRILKRMNTETSKEALSYLIPKFTYVLYEFRE